MAEILGYLIVGVIAITLAVIAIKIVLALLPVILVIGGICLFVYFLAGTDPSVQKVGHQSIYKKMSQNKVSSDLRTTCNETTTSKCSA